ncbi:BspA family leucine-rich repeat surface protein [Flavobacterium sp. RHBU_24]|uniref:BspA family leucine-rich repeat surface protein n=1 Tax=Flavobacterium sp. RHBU_24 TaxID=3391185 RepID=UPI0039847E14
MKKFYLLFAFAFITFFASAQAPFITTWEVPPGGYGVQAISVPITYNVNNNYSIDFGDGTILSNQQSGGFHNYAAPGTYTVTVSGTFNRIKFSASGGNQTKIRTIEQWGDTQWASNMTDAFKDCASLTINATDTPDLSHVTNMTNFFYGAVMMNQSIDNWDVSNVKNMSYMFSGADSFNQPLNSWNVSNVTDMSYMFYSADSFNQPLNNWDVSSATMVGMFSGADSFNQPLNNWDVSSVTTMVGMFSGADSFNQPLNSWNVSNVTDMSYMFYSADSFNQPLNNWDVSSVTTMVGMFSGSDSFNQPLNSWDTSSVVTLTEMFENATSFNQSLDDWDVSNVTDMTYLFSNSVYNQPLNSWDVSSVTIMGGMFGGNQVFNQPLNNWDVSNVTSFVGMFANATSFNQSLDNWDVSNATSTDRMFKNATSFNQPLNSWNTSNIFNLTEMFFNATSFNQPLDNWDVSNVQSMYGTFYNAVNFNQDISAWNFNPEVGLSAGADVENSFLSYSGMSTDNYDALLVKFAQLQLYNKDFVAEGLKFCNIVRFYLMTELLWWILDDGFDDDCSGNTIFVNVRFDQNANGCDSADPEIHDLLVTADNGTYSYGTYPFFEEEYGLNVQEGAYTVSLQNLPSYFTVAPDTASVNFTGSGNTEPLDFCLTANQAVQDLNVTILPLSDARPGFEASYQLVAQNIGTQTITNASLSLVYDAGAQSFVSASEVPVSNTAGALNFAIGTIQPFESKTINLLLQTYTPPTVNGGDTLNLTAEITPAANDFTPDDNTFALKQTVVNSYDPNDKTVLQGAQITIDQIDGYLDYVVRFQNTGTASAINVRIDDVLDANLDWTTLRPVNASHSYRVKIKEGNKVSFIFDNINLPTESTDEADNNGFIAFKIKPLQTLQIGDVITGSAGIYFDYNAPIITNTVSTTVVAELGVSQNQLNKGISIYPNPVTDVLYLKPQEGIAPEEVKVYNMQGRELLDFKQNLDAVNLQSLSSGLYMVTVKTNVGQLNYRVVKK